MCCFQIFDAFQSPLSFSSNHFWITKVVFRSQTVLALPQAAQLGIHFLLEKIVMSHVLEEPV